VAEQFAVGRCRLDSVGGRPSARVQALPSPPCPAATELCSGAAQAAAAARGGAACKAALAQTRQLPARLCVTLDFAHVCPTAAVLPGGHIGPLHLALHLGSAPSLLLLPGTRSFCTAALIAARACDIRYKGVVKNSRQPGRKLVVRPHAMGAVV
jgi:hypothetical protein